MKLFILLFFSTFPLFGQNIKGIILDKQTKHPIENVHVYINHSKKGTTSNKKGEFSLKLKNRENDTIYFSCIGFVLKKQSFSKLKKSNNIVFYLQKKVESLEEVVVISKNELNPKIHFKKLAPLNTGLHSFASTQVESKIYVFGGDSSYLEETAKKHFNNIGNTPESTFKDLLEKVRENNSWESYKGKLQVYDFKKSSWSTSDLKFIKRAYHGSNYFNNKLYVIGGKRLSTNKKHEYLENNIEVFDLKNNAITIDKTNPHKAVNFESVVYKNNIIIMGGSVKQNKNGKKTYTNKSHIYNLDSGYWYELNEMPKAKEVTAVLVENKIYLIGGFNGNPLSEIESYNISNGKWKKEGELFYGIEKPAIAYNDNIIYIFNNGKISTFNIDTKELNEYEINLNLKASKLYYYNEKIYLLGGYFEDEYSKTPSSNFYSIDLNEFENTKILKSKRLD